MKKKTVLFVIPRLTIGGAQKSMLNALRFLNYDKYEVSLYVRENKLTLMDAVPKQVHVIVNSNTHNYEYDISSLSLEFVKRIATFIRCNKLKRWADKKNKEHIFRKKLSYEKKKFFPEGHHYDYLISYVNGYNCRFSMEVVKATHKFCFYLGATDNNPELHKRYLPQYDKIVVDNSNVKEFLCEHIPEINKKICVIENFIDYKEVREKGLQEKVESLGNDYILCSCGRFSKEKGFDLAVESAKILKQKNLSFVWYFVGDGPEREMLEKKIAAYQLDANIVITGMQENPYPFIANCDIYIQPSYDESFGLTITEAKMLTKPVVSTKTMGGCKQIEDFNNGILADISPESVAESILKYVNDTSLKVSIVRNLENIDYSTKSEQYVNKWNALLED